MKNKDANPIKMITKITYEFSANLWRHSANGGWHFISMPKNISKEIRDHLKWQEEGWGRMKVSAIINELQWETSIWFDKKMNTYILPIKAEIRKNLSLKEGMMISASILI